jgi:NADPH:quinone reductase-like Zn-dependent oxidoreductase
MPAFVPAPDAPGRIALDQVPEPEPAPDETLVVVEAYSVNRGEPSSWNPRVRGRRPGQDVAGHVERTAADGSGPAQGARVVRYALGQRSSVQPISQNASS